MRSLPAVARRVELNPESYVYLAESIRRGRRSVRWPSGSPAAGWSGVSWRNLSGGVVALHRADQARASKVRPPRLQSVGPPA